MIRRSIYLITIAFILILYSCTPAQHAWHGSPYPDPAQAPEIVLQSTVADEFRPSDQRGKVVLLFFGYTSCPDVCPATVAEMRFIFHALGDAAEKVIFAFITVDPERDTLQVLRNFLALHDPRFIGLAGNPNQIEAIKQAYGVFSAKDPSDDPEVYFITHTSRLFLVDMKGILQTNYTFEIMPDDILSDLRFLLGEIA